jgi:hypothetical protein
MNNKQNKNFFSFFFGYVKKIIVNLIVKILIIIENYTDLSSETNSSKFILIFVMHKMLMKIKPEQNALFPVLRFNSDFYLLLFFRKNMR